MANVSKDEIIVGLVQREANALADLKEEVARTGRERQLRIDAESNYSRIHQTMDQVLQSHKDLELKLEFARTFFDDEAFEEQFKVWMAAREVHPSNGKSLPEHPPTMEEKFDMRPPTTPN